VPPSGAAVRVDAVLAVVDEFALDAGFIYDGERRDIDDPLGLANDTDESPLMACLPDADGVIADDGGFVGQLAGSSSGAYYFTDGEETELGEMARLDHPMLTASVAIVDDEARPTLLAVVEELASEQFAECVAAAADEWKAAIEAERTAAEQDFPAVEISLSSDDLDIGDAAVLFTTIQSGRDDDGERHSATGQVATAMAGDTLIIVTHTVYDGDDDPAASPVIVAALEAAVDAAG